MSKETQKPMTWANIKAFANSLTDDQLKCTAIWWGDGEGGKVEDVNILDEDYVLYDDIYQPKTIAIEQAFNDAEEIDSKAPVMPEGTPILWIKI